MPVVSIKQSLILVASERNGRKLIGVAICPTRIKDGRERIGGSCFVVGGCVWKSFSVQQEP